MNEGDAIALIRETGSLVFTTREFMMLGNIRISFASQMLRRLAAKKRLTRLFQGLWADTQNPSFNAYKVVPFLTRPHPAAVSLTSALHLQGMTEQIPQVISVVSTAATREIETPVGHYSLHQIDPAFFEGYSDYRDRGEFLIASPEKAIVDCAYLSARKGRRYLALPQIHLPKGFSRRRASAWVKIIPYPRLRVVVQKRLDTLLKAVL